ncbi:protein kinase [Nocardiopsis exhalans]|uniref:non-specific serine/threonine protein kinase n=1 Tax=Nocardiopsis exhalans TaxID=163604 RepID=A0ABY5DBV9_9ACTN|nr:protein kinase [Nocardiopsis exhalans]USY21844.1 protein kinase [Nocardiopsis exhalans]
MNIGDELGGYELLEVLGRGGFGTVYLGRGQDGQLAAVKVLHHHYADNPQFRARFRAEVEHSMRVVDFCIARVLAAAPDGDPPWVASEYVEGPTLRQFVHSGKEDGGPLHEGDLYRIAVATATALTAIHASDVVHRDFTPSNIMVAPDGIRVIDFGIARALENSPVSASALLGTPRYMAPEQFLGSRVTPAIDVFAWGSVIAFAGTGKDIFTGENLAVTLRKVLFEKPDLTGLPDSLASIVRWCLYKDPQLRPTSQRLLATLLGVAEPGGGHPQDRLPGYTGRSDLDILALGNQIGQGSGTIDITAIPRLTQAPPDRDELFEIGGESYSSAAALALDIQRDWNTALALLRNAPLRQDLLRWLPESHEQARRTIGQLPEDWGGADVQAANLIADLDPALPPIFDKLDMSWGALFATRGGRSWPYRGEEYRRLLRLVEQGNLLEPFSRHHCVASDHECAATGGCEPYARVARQTRAMFASLRNCEAWLEQLGKGFGLTPTPIPPDQRGDLVHVLATDPRSRCDRWELAAWAVEGIAQCSERDQVYRAVGNSDDPWPEAVVFRAHRDDFRELAERIRQEESASGPDPAPQDPRSELARLERRDPKLLVRFFYGLGATLVALAVAVGTVWNSLTFLAVVAGVIGLLFGGIGLVMAHDHERALRRLREKSADLPERTEKGGRPPVGPGRDGGRGAATRSGDAVAAVSESGQEHPGGSATAPASQEPSPSSPLSVSDPAGPGVRSGAGGAPEYFGEDDLDLSPSDRIRLRESVEAQPSDRAGTVRDRMGMSADERLAARSAPEPRATAPLGSEEGTGGASLGSPPESSGGSTERNTGESREEKVGESTVEWTFERGVSFGQEQNPGS